MIFLDGLGILNTLALLHLHSTQLDSLKSNHFLL